jgi:hypothetical protein
MKMEIDTQIVCCYKCKKRIKTFCPGYTNDFDCCHCLGQVTFEEYKLYAKMIISKLGKLLFE